MMNPDPAKRPREYKELLSRIDQILAQSPTQEFNAVPAVQVSTDGTSNVQQLPTLEVVSPQRNYFCSSRWLVAGALVFVVGLVGWSFFPRDFLRPTRRQYQPSSYSVPLFNGTSLDLSIWRPEPGGSWHDAVNDEKAKVIEGMGTTFVRLVHPAKGGEGTVSVPNHELTFQVQLHQAKEVEFTFGIPVLGGSARAVRLTPGKAELGSIAFPSGVFRSEEIFPIPDEDPNIFHVRIDQEENRCWVEIGGHPSPGFYLSGKDFQPRIRLRTVGGAAWFSDFELTGLVRK
ncbi:MAG: hypothetical protein U0903_04525 [Planctomycetales bacterium]